MSNKKEIELTNEQLDKVTGGVLIPEGTGENIGNPTEDKPILENLQDNKGADE